MSKVSIVVASHRAGLGTNVLRCLKALEGISETKTTEVIVVDNSRDGTSETIAQRFPQIRLIRAPKQKLIPHLWELGIRQASGDIVAITTGDFVPEKDWVEQILKAHEGTHYSGIGGAIENEPGSGIVSRAIYFCRYSAYMLPLEKSRVKDFAADNASYKRSVLQRYGAMRRHGFWESAIHAQMTRDGLELLLTPNIVVCHHKSFSFLGFMKQRFLHGRRYGADRAKDFSTIRRQLYILVSPLIPIVFLWRITRQVIAKKRNIAEYLSAVPVMFLFLLGWSAGELIGYLSTPTEEDVEPSVRRPRLRHFMTLSGIPTNIGLSLLTVLLSLALCEGFFRAIAFDFAKQEQAWRETPLFGQQPIVPTGEVFFRHPGPAMWSGRLLSLNAAKAKLPWDPYGSEDVVTAKYDRLGFRNPDGLSDWDIAVAGDSFTELGYLPYDQLFTTILGRALNRKVLNLGTSYTGPLTQLSYLKQYGLAKSTRDAVIVFFEGNDLTDLDREYADLMHWQQTGQRPYRHFEKQISFIKAVYASIKQLHGRFNKGQNFFNAYFQSPGADIPIMLSYAPPDRSQIKDRTLQHLDYFVSEYAKLGRDRQVTVWLAYMPGKERVLYGHIRFSDATSIELKNWRPTDLPDLISEFCHKYGIKFVDLTPALVAETRKNMHLLYNSVLDSHLNAMGSSVVASELARHFQVSN